MLYLRAHGDTLEYPLPLLTEELGVQARDWYEAGKCSELVDPADILTNLPRFPFPRPVVLHEPEPAIGELHWPVVGASRYARGLFVIDGWTLDQIQSRCTTVGAGPAVDLIYYDQPDAEPAETGRVFPLNLLAIRPFVQTQTGARPSGAEPPAEDDLWVVTLVDQRYYWLFSTGSDLASGDPAPSSWSDLFDSLAAALPTSDTFAIGDAVPSAYLTPSDRWTADAMVGLPTPFLLDAAAACTGSRIVSLPDGTFETQRPTAAPTAQATAFDQALRATRCVVSISSNPNATAVAASAASWRGSSFAFVTWL